MSTLTCFFKVYENYFFQKYRPFVNALLSEYAASYRELKEVL